MIGMCNDRRDERDVQTAFFFKNVYETEFVFRSLMAWGKKLLLSLSVFAIMLLKRLPDGSKQKRWLPGVIWVFDDFSSSAFAAFEVDDLQRGESRPWDALS